MAFINRIIPLGLSTFNAASLTANYQAINSGGFSQSALIIKIQNDNSTDITISFDGTNDHEFLAGTAAAIPRESLILNFISSPSTSGYIYMAKGTVVYVKGSAGVGSIVLSAYSQQEI